MSFFTDHKDIFQNISKKQLLKKSFKQLYNYFNTAYIGDIIIYYKNIKKFVILSKDKDVNINLSDNNIIIIGIVLYQDSTTLETTILIKNFLMEQSLSIPLDYLAKEQYIPVYIKNMYDRYISKFKRESPSVKKIKKLKLQIIQLQQLSYIFDLETSFKKLIGDEKTNEFYQKLKYTPIYVNYNGKLKLWSYSSALNKSGKIDNIEDGIKDISIIGGNFLVTTKINFS